MKRDDNSIFLLFIEPTIEDKSEEPVFDEMNKVLMMAIQDSIQGVSNYSNLEAEPTFSEGARYKGFHVNCDHESSTNYDLYLPNGMITNSLALHYLTWFRKAIPQSDWDKLEKLQRYYGRVDTKIPLTRW